MQAEIDAASHEELTAIIGRLESLKARAWSRLMSATPEAKTTDRTLNAREVAKAMGVGKDYVYLHADELPFAWRRGKMLRFSETGMHAWLAEQKGSAQ